MDIKIKLKPKQSCLQKRVEIRDTVSYVFNSYTIEPKNTIKICIFEKKKPETCKIMHSTFLNLESEHLVLTNLSRIEFFLSTLRIYINRDHYNHRIAYILKGTKLMKTIQFLRATVCVFKYITYISLAIVYLIIFLFYIWVVIIIVTLFRAVETFQLNSRGLSETQKYYFALAL